MRTLAIKSASLVVALAACGGAPGIPQVTVAVSGPAEPVEFGRGFPVVVTRSWTRDLSPAEWNDRALLPLVAGPAEVARSESGGVVTEVRRLRVHAFHTPDVVVPPLRFEAQQGAAGVVHASTSEPLRVVVRPVVDPSAPGDAEPDDRPLPRPRRSRAWFAFFGLAPAAAAWFAIRRSARRRSRVVDARSGPAADPSADLAAQAAARLERWRAACAASAGDDASEFSAAIRAWIGAVSRCDALARTSEELAESRTVSAALGSERAGSLVACLARCEIAIYGGRPFTAAEREELGARAAVQIAAAPVETRP